MWVLFCKTGKVIQCITKVSTPLTFLQIFKYISSWDNTDKMTLWHNESSNMAPHGKELSEDLNRCIVALHEVGLGYKQIANTPNLSCSSVAKITQRFKSAGSSQKRARVGRPEKLSARAERHIQMFSLKDRRRSSVSIAAEIEEVGGQPVSAQTMRPTLHQIGLHGCHPRRKPLLKTIHKKACSLLKICQQSTWITGTMSYGLMRWRLICLDPTASSMCGGDQVRSTKISVSCLQSSLVVGMSWSGAPC